MSERANFTKEAIARLRVPAGADRLQVYDTRQPALALTVRQSGARTFYVYRRVDGRPERIRLGTFPEMTIEQARNAAAGVVGDIARGINPKAERCRARASMTLAELFNHFLETHAKHHKKSWRTDKLLFERYIGKAPADRREGDEPAPFVAWRNRKVNTLTEPEVKAMHAKIGTNHGPYGANRLLVLLRTMFNNARLPNPTKGVKRFREQERERFLHPDELPRFFQALADEPNVLIRDFMLVAILTGARRSNVQAMRWAEVNLERATWEIPDTKAGKPQTVHLAPPAVVVLSTRRRAGDLSEYVFPGHGKSGHLTEPKHAWARILKRASIADLRIHDLRRTLGSWQAAGGASLPIIGKTLGHKNERTTRIYARLTLDPIKQSVNAATGAMTALMPKGLLPAPDEQAK